MEEKFRIEQRDTEQTIY